MRAVIILFFLSISLSLFSQEAKKDDDVKVGLVLSGGGAKGFAHIGVLKVIDSLGIKIDYIAGTSIGAIVGSLYASGYTGKQLDSIFSKLTFNDIVSDDISRASKTFYERDNSERHALTLPFDNFKIKLPSGISRGQNVFNILSRLLFHVNEVKDFNKLPIPFFCIATDIEDGTQVILDKGDLTTSVLASGAIPSLFRPITINNQILVDGGVVNNYPIDELRAKGMDIIIGVDVQDALFPKEKLKSGPDILLQVSNFRTIEAMKTKSKQTDIYIRPDIKDFSVLSFSQGEQIIENGKIAAYKKLDELTDLRKKTKEKTSKVKITPIDSINVKTIYISGNKEYTRSYILGKLKIKSDEKISYQNFNTGVSNIVATDNFETFLYDFKPREDGYDLYLNVKESEQTTFIKLAAHYDDLYRSAALVNLTKKQLLFNNDVATIDLILGDNIRYDFEYYIDKGFYWSIGLKSRYNGFDEGVAANLFLSEEQLVTFDINQLNLEVADFTNQLYFQTLFRKDFSLTLGAEHKRLRITSETIISEEEDPEVEEITFENSDFISVFGGLKFDSLDDRYFPRQGFFFDGDFHLYLTSSDFNNNFSQFSIAKANIGFVQPLGKRVALTIGSEGGFRIGDDSNMSLNFGLGGYGNDFINNYTPFLGYDYLSLIGDSFVKGLVNLDYEFINKHHINATANFANVEDDIFTTGEWITAPDFSGYALGYGYESIIGPVEVKVSWSPETERTEIFFAVGFWF